LIKSIHLSEFKKVNKDHYFKLTLKTTVYYLRMPHVDENDWTAALSQLKMIKRVTD